MSNSATPLTRVRSLFSSVGKTDFSGLKNQLSVVSDQLSDDKKVDISTESTMTNDLDLVEQLIEEKENEERRTQDEGSNVTDQVLPGFLATDPYQNMTGSPVKERIGQGQIIEQGVSAGPLEVERSPELPVEVEGFLEKVEEDQNQLPQEIVVGDGQNLPPVSVIQKTPVVVLPLTEEEQKSGEKKSPKFSIRWLVEFSKKLIKMFSGKIIYKVEETN